MLILLTWIAWFSIVVAVFLGLLNSLVVVATHRNEADRSPTL